MLGPRAEPVPGCPSQARCIDTVRQSSCPLSYAEEVPVETVDAQMSEHLTAAASHLRAARFIEVGDIAGAMALVQEITRLAQAIGLDLTAAAHQADTARDQGAASTQAWLAHTGGVSHREAAGDLKLANDLRDIAPQTRAAMDRPGMSPAKAKVITGAMGKLPGELGDSQRAAVEADLVDRAQKHSIDDLRRAAKRAVEVIDRDQADEEEASTLKDEEDRAHRQSEFWMRPADQDGMVEGGFTLPQLEADILKSALESHTAPRHNCATQPDETTDLVDEKPTYRHKLGRAFAEIIGHLSTDSFGNHGGIAATLVVTTDYETLKGDVQRAGTDSHGSRVSPETIRLIACTAGILPFVMGGSSKVLDHGFLKRLFTSAQRIALALRDGGCAFPGCDRPPGWCEAHHMIPWTTRRRTHLKDGVLLCGRHHRIIHHTDWEVRPARDGTPEFIPPASVDPHRRPRTNDRWRPATNPPATYVG